LVEPVASLAQFGFAAQVIQLKLKLPLFVCRLCVGHMLSLRKNLPKAYRSLLAVAIRKKDLLVRYEIKSLERFIRKEPLRRVHECVFSVLALESETVDPRLSVLGIYE
jgi:hypothetical protein